MNDRDYWISTLCKIATPVLDAAISGTLVEKMSILVEDHKKSAPLEAVGRLLAGMAPWLENGLAISLEYKLGQQMLTKVKACLTVCTDPTSPSYLHFGETPQSLVDTAFLALAILRAPVHLWYSMPSDIQQNIINALEAVRHITASESNWLLFSAMIEVALNFMYGERRYHLCIDYAILRFGDWYVGDGLYMDGLEFSFDYYNSIVIHPFLAVILEREAPIHRSTLYSFKQTHLIRSVRYAKILERMIAPDGSFPVAGRSLSYRCGVFHHLAYMAGKMHNELDPGQHRAALTAVIRSTLDVPNTFDSQYGLLQIGLAGKQPSLAEEYISVGSLYICTAAFLPLGLLPVHDFWTKPALDWTSCQIWSGKDVQADRALKEY